MHADRFESLKRQYQTWASQMLPLSTLYGPDVTPPTSSR
jgi:hypothetical protein